MLLCYNFIGKDEVFHGLLYITTCLGDLMGVLTGTLVTKMTHFGPHTVVLAYMTMGQFRPFFIVTNLIF